MNRRTNYIPNIPLSKYPRSIYVERYLRRLYFYVVFLVISLIFFALFIRISSIYSISTIFVIGLYILSVFIAVAISYTVTHRRKNVSLDPKKDGRYVTEKEALSILHASRAELKQHVERRRVKINIANEHEYYYNDLVYLRDKQKYDITVDRPMLWVKRISDLTIESLINLVVVLVIIIGILYETGNLPNVRPRTTSPSFCETPQCVTVP